MGNRQETFLCEVIDVTGTIPSYIIGVKSIDYVYFIEDIFSYCIVGKIAFRDSTGMREFGPLTGNERIKITYGAGLTGTTTGNMSSQNQKYREIIFHIFDMGKTTNVSPSQNLSGDTLELTLVDEYFMKMHYNNIKQSWYNSYIHDIVGEIMSKHVGIDTGGMDRYHKAKEKLDHFDTNSRTPSECLSWLINRCSDASSGSPGYLMFRSADRETLGYKFNFCSIDRLLSNKNLSEPKGDNYAYHIATGNEGYINHIYEYDTSLIDKNALRRLLVGKVTGYDIKRKKLIERSFTHKDGLAKTTCLGRYSLFPQSITGIITDPLVINDNYYDEAILDNLFLSNWMKQYCLLNMSSIVVKGHELRNAGSLIRIVWPSRDPQQHYDKQMDGKFLIKSVTNYFSPYKNNFWTQRMVLIKNGYRDSNSTVMIPATKENG